MFTGIVQFESPDLTPWDLSVGLDKERSLQKKSEYTRWNAPLSLDAVGLIKKSEKNNSDEQHTIFPH